MNEALILVQKGRDPVVQRTVNPYLLVRKLGHRPDKFSQVPGGRRIEGHRDMHTAHSVRYDDIALFGDGIIRIGHRQVYDHLVSGVCNCFKLATFGLSRRGDPIGNPHIVFDGVDAHGHATSR